MKTTTPRAFACPSLQQYDEHLALRSVSQRTREEYGRYLRVFCVQTGRDPAGLEEPDARAYLLYLKETKRFAPGSMRYAKVATLVEAILVLTHPEPPTPPLHLRCPHCQAFALEIVGRLPRPRPP